MAGLGPKKILVLGSGGREHALVWHLKKFSSYHVECAPGSDGISQLCPVWSFGSFDSLLRSIQEKQIDLVIVGPEKYLAEGVADFLVAHQINVFGPTQKAAQLESDKAWAKSFCQRHQIPQARTSTASSAEEFQKALTNFKPPYVVKASGLAAGKGVWIGDDKNEALQFAKEALKVHPHIVIEEFIRGEELSFFALVENDQFLILGAAQDHKRLLENDQGPNTGGMGAYSPVPLLNAALQEKIVERVLKPTLKGLVSEKIPYRGFIFLGMMIQNQEPSLLEYNCRLGDPETQALMLRLETPLPDLIDSLSQGRPLTPRLSSQVSLNVVVAASGYPDQPKSGFTLPGIDQPPADCVLFHSGTKKENGEWVATGGRLFSINTRQKSLLECQTKIYPWLESLSFFSHVTYRRDIAVRAYTHLLHSESAL